MIAFVKTLPKILFRTLKCLCFEKILHFFFVLLFCFTRMTCGPHTKINQTVKRSVHGGAAGRYDWLSRGAKKKACSIPRCFTALPLPVWAWALVGFYRAGCNKLHPIKSHHEDCDSFSCLLINYFVSCIFDRIVGYNITSVCMFTMTVPLCVWLMCVWKCDASSH